MAKSQVEIIDAETRKELKVNINAFLKTLKYEPTDIKFIEGLQTYSVMILYKGE